MKASRSLLISCLLALAFGHCVAAAHEPRQGTDTSTGTPPSTPSSPTTPTPPPVTSKETPSGTTPSSSPPTVVTPPPSDTSLKPTDTVTPPPTNVSKPPPETTPPPPPPESTPPPNTVVSTSTDASGVEVTITETRPPTLTSPTDSATNSSTNPAKQDDNSGLGVGPIIGMSVAGGVAVIAIIGFFVWKFTRKRFSDFDDNEAIKWPELNTHGGNPDSHPLPVHNTGRSGFDTGSEASLSRVPSSSNYSTPDVGGVGPDPYAVPPLPHLNPNQPYRDDPTAATGYYDPYRGPIPGTLEHGAAGGEWGGEVIPMTQLAGNQGRMSPAPHNPYGGDQMYDVGRRSPGPQAAYGGDPMYDVGRRSPGPQTAYAAAGRTASPGPQAAYGGRASPGPQAAYTAGRMSPGPHAAYDYGGRQ